MLCTFLVICFLRFCRIRYRAGFNLATQCDLSQNWSRLDCLSPFISFSAELEPINKMELLSNISGLGRFDLCNVGTCFALHCNLAVTPHLWPYAYIPSVALFTFFNALICKVAIHWQNGINISVYVCSGLFSTACLKCFTNPQPTVRVYFPPIPLCL